jgi:hypothetical protein
MRFVIDRNVVMRRMTVHLKFRATSGDGHKRPKNVREIINSEWPRICMHCVAFVKELLTHVHTDVTVCTEFAV